MRTKYEMIGVPLAKFAEGIEYLCAVRFKLILILLTLVKLWLVIGTSLVASYSPHDDLLFLNLAGSFLMFLDDHHESWLGAYNQLTLAKGPIYPLFLVANFASGLPLLFTQSLLYITSGLMLTLSLRRIIAQSSVLVFLYAIYIFNSEMITRVIRDGIYPALTVLVIAGLIGIYVHRESTLSKLSLWSVFLGIALSIFWMTREEGIWIIPSFFLIASYTLFLLYRRFGTSYNFLKRTMFCIILPLVILFGNIQLVSLINKIYYDVYTVVEFKSIGFLSAYGALSRVKHPHFNRYIPVPKEVRHSIYAVSSSFKELEFFLEGSLQGWGNHNCRIYPDTCGDIGGGWFMWALRDAVAMAGYYKSGGVAESYYLQLAEEINSACDKGLLDCIGERATMTPPFHKEYIPLLAEAFFQGLNGLISFKGASQWLSVSAKSSGTEELLVLFRDLTREDMAPLEPTASSPITIDGWAFTPTEVVDLRVQSRDSQIEQTFSVARGSGQDVYEAFAKNHQEYENAKNSRFSITSACVKNCELVFYTKSTLLATINLENPDDRKILSSLPFYFYIDSIKTPSTPQHQLLAQNRLDAIKIKLLQNIAGIYYATIPWLAHLGIGLYLISIIKLLIFRQMTFLLVLNTTILVAIAFRLLILSYIHITSFPGINPLYFAPLYPLLLIFIVLAVVEAVNISRQSYTPRVSQ